MNLINELTYNSISSMYPSFKSKSTKKSNNKAKLSEERLATQLFQEKIHKLIAERKEIKRRGENKIETSRIILSEAEQREEEVTRLFEKGRKGKFKSFRDESTGNIVSFEEDKSNKFGSVVVTEKNAEGETVRTSEFTSQYGSLVYINYLDKNTQKTNRDEYGQRVSSFYLSHYVDYQEEKTPHHTQKKAREVYHMLDDLRRYETNATYIESDNLFGFSTETDEDWEYEREEGNVKVSKYGKNRFISSNTSRRGNPVWEFGNLGYDSCYSGNIYLSVSSHNDSINSCIENFGKKDQQIWKQVNGKLTKVSN